jgi:[ribosomal protein S5]-alanine N-acetyltransferase
MPTHAIETDRLLLRSARQGDAPSIASYYRENREHLAPWEPLRPDSFFTDAFWQSQITRDLVEEDAERQVRFFLFDRTEPDRIVGMANFSQIVRGVFHGCVLGYSVAARAEGRGYMREALAGAIEYLFRDLRLHRIGANYMPHNVRSGRLLRSLGFVVEGYARDYLYIAGRWEDHVLTGLTNPDWQPLRPAAESER